MDSALKSCVFLQVEMLINRIQGVLREVGARLLAMRVAGPISGTWYASQLKSEADLVAEAMILEALREISPTLPVVSEEDIASHAIDRAAQYWLVDPIDGTASYCGGFSGFVTQIALMNGELPVLAAVYAPALDLMYVAEEGAGATLNGVKLEADWQNGSIILTDNYPKPTGLAEYVHERLPCSNYLESGSIGLKICRVADGQADLFVKDVLVRDWDLAPGHLILKEAGGVLTDLVGRDVGYSGGMEQTGGLIAAASRSLGGRVASFLADNARRLSPR